MYNSPKKLYVLYHNESSQYVQEISSNWGDFCTSRVFFTRDSAHNTAIAYHTELYSKGVVKVREALITKWQF